MKIWVDELRTPPDVSWLWCQDPFSSLDAMITCQRLEETVEVFSLDPNIDNQFLVAWCSNNDYWPARMEHH